MICRNAHCTCITICLITILHIIYSSHIQHFNLYAVTKHLKPTPFTIKRSAIYDIKRWLWPQVTNDRKGDLKVWLAQFLGAPTPHGYPRNSKRVGLRQIRPTFSVGINPLGSFCQSCGSDVALRGPCHQRH